jgi:hypothetical protein
MGKTRKFLLIAGLLLCAQLCFAKQISFQIIQYDDRTQNVTEQSLVIEDELLNGLFETGYIVTNSPTISFDSGSDETALYNKAMGDAYEGFSDYFLQIKVYYKNALNKINWSLASVSNGKIIKESEITGSVTTNDEKGMKKISSKLVSDITNFLKSYKA